MLLQHIDGGCAAASVKQPRLSTQGSSMDLRAALTSTFLGAGGSLMGGSATLGALSKWDEAGALCMLMMHHTRRCTRIK